MPPAATDLQAGAGHLLLPEADGLGAEAAHHQRRFHGLEFMPFAEGAPAGCLTRLKPDLSIAADSGLPMPRVIDGQVAHLQHLLDGRDAGDGIFAELADAIGERTQQPVANVNRAAAHARDHAGVFGLGAVELDEDHVVAGAARPTQNAQNLNLHRLGLGSGEDRPGGRGHAAAHLAEREEAAAGGRRSRGSGCGRSAPGAKA